MTNLLHHSSCPVSVGRPINRLKVLDTAMVEEREGVAYCSSRDEVSPVKACEKHWRLLVNKHQP
jgi:hypothetical protein